jgi:phosphoribosylglycinamide formyltransferase-1
MAAGSPGVPALFTWRGNEYRVLRVLGTRKTLRDCHHSAGIPAAARERYVNKHYVTVETASGEIMTLYRTRSGSKKDSWTLYTVKAAPTDAAPQGKKPMHIAVLVSGGGTNLQALIDSQELSIARGMDDPDRGAYEIAVVIADRDCYALERARAAGIPAVCAPPPAGLSRPEARRAVSDQVLAIAREYRADALVLAGFLTIMSGDVIAEYSNRILNLHPALLPKFGGHGMWGHHVHEAVLASGDAESGCTVHLVDAGCDTGPILLQKKVPVLPGDTAETLAARISGREHEAIVEGVRILSARLAKEETPGVNGSE